MSHEPSTSSEQVTSARRVLLWRPDADEAQVQPDLDEAAKFLNVHRDGVIAAIATGELLAGWFVDWEVTDAR